MGFLMSEDLKQILDRYERPIRTNQPADEAKKREFAVTISFVNSPQGEPHQSEPAPQWYQFIEKYKTLIDVLALFAASIAAGIAVYCATIYHGQMLANRTQAAEAVKQSGLMLTNTMLDERAWVLPKMDSIETLQIDGSTVFQIPFRNLGKTPAENVRVYASGTANLSQLTNADVFPTPSTSYSVLAPNSDGKVRTYPVELWRMADITNGVPNWIFGAAQYDDIFGFHHWSQFCYLISKKMDGVWAAAAVHNDIDTNQP